MRTTTGLGHGMAFCGRGIGDEPSTQRFKPTWHAAGPRPCGAIQFSFILVKQHVSSVCLSSVRAQHPERWFVLYTASSVVRLPMNRAIPGQIPETRGLRARDGLRRILAGEFLWWPRGYAHHTPTKKHRYPQFAVALRSEHLPIHQSEPLERPISGFARYLVWYS